jgi:type IV pilus assembly protein PilC
MKFKYQARTKSGDIRSGIIEASNEEAAVETLQRYGLFVTLLENVKEEALLSKEISFLERVKEKDLVIFIRQLSIMLKAGVTPVEALNTLAVQIENPTLRERVLKISNEVESGTVLSKAFSLFPEIFPSYFIAVLKAGEASGELSQTLGYLADYIENQFYIKSKIRSALTYPIFVIFLFVVIFIFLMIFVIPNITQVLLQTGKELPTTTKIVISISAFFQKWILWVIMGTFGMLLAAFKYFKSEEGKSIFDRYIIKVPIFGPFFVKMYVNRIAQNLGTLIKAGVPIIQALEITEEIVGNSYYQEIVKEVKESVSKGKPMSETLMKYPSAIPPLVSQMVRVGERTGKTAQAFDYILEFYQKEIEIAIDKFLAMIEPIMIVGLGLMVAFLAASVLMPIYQTMSF